MTQPGPPVTPERVSLDCAASCLLASTLPQNTLWECEGNDPSARKGRSHQAFTENKESNFKRSQIQKSSQIFQRQMICAITSGLISSLGNGAAPSPHPRHHWPFCAPSSRNCLNVVVRNPQNIVHRTSTLPVLEDSPINLKKYAKSWRLFSSPTAMKTGMASLPATVGGSQVPRNGVGQEKSQSRGVSATLALGRPGVGV